MSFNFTPLTDEQLDMAHLLPPGIYDFEVLKSERKVSSTGNPMASLILKVFTPVGEPYTVFDRLIFSTVNMNIRKIKHFCDTVGLIDQYNQGILPEDLSRYSGQCKVEIEEEKPDNKGGFYPKKNIISDYIKPEGSSNTRKEVQSNFIDDEIPF